ncbi:MAG: hypothetical protein DME66_07195 [Verrucomicrobia bacterium]|nr:MAG: hypothetical protein DME66_07195 [Verrucomicrobiota bacterium]
MRSKIFCTHRVGHVWRSALPALHASVPPSRVLPLLPVLGNANFFARWAGDCYPAFAQIIYHLSRFFLEAADFARDLTSGCAGFFE